MALPIDNNTAYVVNGSGDLYEVSLLNGSGSKVASFSLPFFDVALSPDGSLWATTSSTLYRLNVGQQTAERILSYPQNENFNALAFDATGTLYAYSASGRLVQVDVAGGTVTTLSTGGPNSDGDLLSLRGQFFVAAEGDLYRLAGASSSEVADLDRPFTFGLTASPEGLVIGFDGTNVYSVNTTTGATSNLFSLASLGVGSVNGATSPNDFLLARTMGTDAAEAVPGSANADVILSGAGNDTVTAADGADLVYGNSGDDMLYGNRGSDMLFGGQGIDIAFGGQDEDIVYGNMSADFIYGNLEEDVLYGGAGDDMLFGGGDDDVLYGNRDNDTLFGNRGDDSLYGGAGADLFVFGPGGDDNDDRVYDFNAAEGDRIRITGGAAYTIQTGSSTTISLAQGQGSITLVGTTSFDPGWVITG